ncbi:unnamed protein product [Rangifer tarandus platyrhynchus]|uniref:Uncharacterized protein n=2 Tax=Rangifer tarandus platyrhynchus TaxID=3082113 RepID=A0AC59YIV4_RANTA|nr:unnamed protein product [Rangifer tarandus platyrhynchus]
MWLPEGWNGQGHIAFAPWGISSNSMEAESDNLVVCRLEVMLERRDILLLGILLPPQISAVFITCTSSFLWENSQQCFLETDMFQKLGFMWISLFLPLEMRHEEKCWNNSASILKGLCEFSQR